MKEKIIQRFNYDNVIEIQKKLEKIDPYHIQQDYMRLAKIMLKGEPAKYSELEICDGFFPPFMPPHTCKKKLDKIIQTINENKKGKLPNGFTISFAPYKSLPDKNGITKVVYLLSSTISNSHIEIDKDEPKLFK